MSAALLAKATPGNTVFAPVPERPVRDAVSLLLLDGWLVWRLGDAKWFCLFVRGIIHHRANVHGIAACASSHIEVASDGHVFVGEASDQTNRRIESRLGEWLTAPREGGNRTYRLVHRRFGAGCIGGWTRCNPTL